MSWKPVDDPISMDERPEGLARQQESSYETPRVNGTSVTEESSASSSIQR